MSKYYEVVLYTASLSNYADPLMDILDADKSCTARLFREHCTLTNGVYVKDLTLLGRDISQVIIVDNSPNSYKLQPENAIPCTTWYDDLNDTELYDLTPLLIELSKPSVKDVTQILRKIHSPT